jgi:hypothetical protein
MLAILMIDSRERLCHSPTDRRHQRLGVENTYLPIAGRRFDSNVIESGRNLSTIACSIKGDVKEHFSPATGGADVFPRHPAL